MINRLNTFFLVALVIILFAANVAKGVEVDRNRLIRMTGAIGPNVNVSVDRLIALSQESKDPIYLLINSPGGSVMHGLIFIDAMEVVKKEGVELRCITSIISASMAFEIYAHCNTRYATPNAHLMFHPARALPQDAITADEAADIAKNLKEIDKVSNKYLQSVMQMNEELFRYAFKHETLWGAETLAKSCNTNFMIITSEYIGIEDLLFKVKD